jgi:prolipoprotein diacylglyceryltransferase
MPLFDNFKESGLGQFIGNLGNKIDKEVQKKVFFGGLIGFVLAMLLFKK